MKEGKEAVLMWVEEQEYEENFIEEQGWEERLLFSEYLQRQVYRGR